MQAFPLHCGLAKREGASASGEASQQFQRSKDTPLCTCRFCEGIWGEEMENEVTVWAQVWVSLNGAFRPSLYWEGNYLGR